MPIDVASRRKGKTRGGYLSLRAVISATSICLVVIVAAATLSMIYTTSVASLRDVGNARAGELISQLEFKTLTLFDMPMRTLEVLQNITRNAKWDWPSNDPSVLDHFETVLYNLFLASRLQLPGLIIYFWDNTRMSYDLYNATHFRRALLRPSPANDPGGLRDQTIVSYQNSLYDMRDGNQRYDIQMPIDPKVEYRTLNSSIKATLLTVTGYGHSATIAGYATRSYTDARGNGTEKFIALTAPLYIRDSPVGEAFLYAMTGMSISIEQVNKFLADTRVTSNTQAFALERNGVLLGTSMLDRPFLMERAVPPAYITKTVGCATTNALGSTSSGGNFEICRATRANYGYAPLAALPNAVFEVDTHSVAQLKIDGTRWYVASTKVPLTLPGMAMMLVVMMPETDIIGDVVKSRDVGIGVVVALVVVAGAVNFAVVMVLLAPLTGIASRMEKASRFDDEDADHSVSSMTEVATLQRAYYAMNAELNRISSFVPQSVLTAARASPDASDAPSADGDAEEDDEGEIMLTTTTDRAAKSGPSSRHGSIVGTQASGLQSVAIKRIRSVIPKNRTSFDQQSTQSSGSNARANATNMVHDLFVRPQAVTVMVANMCGFVPLLQSTARDTAIAKLSSLVHLVFEAVTKHGGVLSHYHGDHFTATFNTVKRCGSHAASACRASLAVRDAADGVGFGAAVRIGVSTGRCLVGNLGAKDIKAASTVGPAFQQATVLERMARVYARSVTPTGGEVSAVLMPRRTCLDIATCFRFRYVDIIRLPGRDRGVGGTISPIAVLLREIAGAAPAHATLQAQQQQPSLALQQGLQGSGGGGADNDEWLYVVGHTADDDDNGTWNEAFHQLCRGRVQDAKQLVEQYTARLPAVASNGENSMAESAALIKTRNSNADVPAETSGSPSGSASRFATAEDRRTFSALCDMNDESRCSDLGRYYTTGFDV
jgi:class 3 adenylate cyclase